MLQQLSVLGYCQENFPKLPKLYMSPVQPLVHSSVSSGKLWSNVYRLGSQG